MIRTLIFKSAVVAFVGYQAQFAAGADLGDAPLTGISGATLSYRCTLDKVRQPGGDIVGEGVVKLDLTSTEDDAVVVKALGFLSVQYAFNIENTKIQNYTGVFSGEFRSNPDYRPRIYTNHIQFKDFDAAVTSRWDGGGMFGELVVEKKLGEEMLQAHYIFQAGDHIGGTMDLSCRLVGNRAE